MNKLAYISMSLLSIALLSVSPVALAAAQEIVQEIAQAEATTPIKPDWAQNNYNSATGLDFIGLSQLWVVGPPQAESKSVAEACTDGLGKISEYFNVQIESKSSSSQVVVNEQFQGQFTVVTDKFSTLNLTGVNAIESYSERVAQGQYIQSYCLYRLSRQQVNQIKLRLAQEQQEIQELVTVIGAQLMVRDITQAKIHLALLKGKPNVSAQLTAELSQLVQEFADAALRVDMVFSQHAFAANDVMAVQLQTNQNLFIYQFVDDGRFISMLLPSPAYGFNLVHKDTPKKFPTQHQLQTGNFYKLPRLSQLSRAPTVYLIASKQRLAIPFTQPSFNSFIVNDKAGFKTFMELCRLDESCLVLEQQLVLVEHKLALDIQQFSLQVNQMPQPNLARLLRANLIEQGFSFTDQGFDLIVNIDYKKVFSKKLSADMFVGELRVFSKKTQQQKPVLKLRHSGIYDPNRVDHYLEFMLHSASIKLLKQVEEHQGEI
jgi:hypothetical protein